MDLEKQCEAEIRKAGFDPLAFTGGISVGDEGNDDFGDLAADEAACGFGGDDEVGPNRGLFIGGNGDDSVFFNQFNATFNGGNGDDNLSNNEDNATFNGGNGDGYHAYRRDVQRRQRRRHGYHVYKRDVHRRRGRLPLRQPG